MAESEQTSTADRYEEEIDLLAIWSQINTYRAMMILIVIGCVTVGLSYAFLTTPIYRSEVLLAQPSGERADASLGALASQFGGLASLSGISIGDSRDVSEAIAILESRRFTYNFIESEGLMPILFEDEWDSAAENWEDPDDSPTISDAYSLFSDEIRNVNYDADTGLVTLRIEWSDRELAAIWANKLVFRLNEFLRRRDTEESERSIEFLNSELKKASMVGLQQGIYGLIEQQIETIMLANVRAEYAFRVLDAAVPADVDDEVWPRKIPIALFSLLSGLFLAVAAALARALVANKD